MKRNDIYISRELTDKLKRMIQAPVGIIVAPAGYGKTTAAREALVEVAPLNAHWFTADKSMTGNENELYEWFVSEMSFFQPNIAKDLSEKGHFNRANRYEISRLIRQIVVQEDEYIIIDNLQYIEDDFILALVSALADNTCDKLHLIILTQYLPSKYMASVQKSMCVMLHDADLMLSDFEIAEYAQQMDIHLDSDQVSRLWQHTQGWIIIISLVLRTIRECGRVPEKSDINFLIYELCWRTLNSTERDLLLYFSIWQVMRKSCLDYVVKEDNISLSEENIVALMTKIPLIKYDYMTETYTMHNILHEYVKLRFVDASEERRNQIYFVAGNWERQLGNNRPSISYYYRAKRYEELLSCDMTNMLMEELGGVAFSDIALELYKCCSDEMFKRNPLSALKLCYALFASAKFDEYELFLERLHRIFLTLHNKQLLGEWMMVSAFKVFPNIKEMTIIYVNAQKYMAHKSEVFTYEEPYMFGCTSMWYLFYTEIGRAEAIADEMDQMIEAYNAITDGHASGAEMLYRGEVYCVEGRFEEAEILAHTAASLALSKKNVSVTYGASLLLGIIAIYRDNMVALEEAIQYLEKYATGYHFMQNTALNKYMVETVRAYLIGLLMETQDTSDWVQRRDIPGAELTFANFMVKTTQITDLILKKEYKKAIANVEASLTLDSRLISLPTKNFMHVGLALCYLAVGNVVKASINLEKSLSLAEKDKNFTFLACFRRYLAPLMLLPNVRRGHTMAIEQIKELKLNYTIVEKKAIFDMLLQKETGRESLTARETEIANLAAKGMHNKEIAWKLSISEFTVKNHLSVIYQKLKIDRRSKLIEMLRI